MHKQTNKNQTNKKEAEWAGKAEPGKAAGEPCKAIFWPTLGFKSERGREIVSNLRGVGARESDLP